MPLPGFSATLDRVRRAVAPEPPTDGRLLARFLQSRDEPAFAELVRRHGPMVLGVCRRVTADRHLAEDAFPAVFLTLARKADRLAGWESVGGWLCQVARRVGRNARRAEDRHRSRGQGSGVRGQKAGDGTRVPGRLPADTCLLTPDPCSAPRPPDDDDLGPVVLEELAGLPDRYRTVLMLHYLDGHPQTAVAVRLGLPAGTVNRRMSEARSALGDRLRARGVAPALAGLGVGLVPAGLSARAVAAGMSPDAVPAAVAALSNGAMRTMFLSKLKLFAAGGLVLTAGVVYAVGAVAGGSRDDRPAPAEAVAAVGPAAEQPRGAKPAPRREARILFWRLPTDAPSQQAAAGATLAAVDPAKKEAAAVAGGPDVGQLTYPFAASPDGRWVAFTAPAERPGGAGIDLTVKVRSIVDAKAEERDLGVNGYPVCWSADGKRVVVADVDAENGPRAHYLVDAASREKTELRLPRVEQPGAKGPVGHLVTDLSRDGTWLLTVCLTGDEACRGGHLYRVKADGSEARRVQGVEAGWNGRFSPDGKSVVFVGPDAEKRARVFVVPAAGGKATAVSPELNGSVDPTGVCWAPDGKTVAYLWCSQENPRFGGEEYELALVTVGADGSGHTTVLAEKTKWQKPIRCPQYVLAPAKE